MRTSILLVGILALAGGWIASASSVHAQSYPPPVGNCVFVPSNANPGLNQDVVMTLIWTDTGGTPLAAQAVTVGIASQPGTGAKLAPGQAITGADGTATFTLNTGPTAGVIALTANCGTIQTQVQAPIGQPPLPPNTGTAGTLTESGLPAASALLATITLAGLAFGAVVLARRRWGVG